MRIIGLLFVALVCVGFIMRNEQPKYEISKGEQLVNRLIGRAAMVIREKYKLKPCGEGVVMPGGPIQKIELALDTRNTYTKEQLRILLIQTAEELLNQVHQDQEIQEFLYTKPFNIKNVGIIIYNNDKKGGRIYDPQTGVTRISEGILSYQTYDPEDEYEYKNEYEESYEEALEVIAKLLANEKLMILAIF